MRDLIITGWKPGLQTISLIRLLRANSDMSLLQAQEAVEQLMDGKEICLPDVSDQRALQLRAQIEALQGICGDCQRSTSGRGGDWPAGMSDDSDLLDEFAYLLGWFGPGLGVARSRTRLIPLISSYL